MGARVHVADADIEDCALSLVPEAVGQYVSSCFVAWGVCCGSSGWGCVAGIDVICTGLQSILIEDRRFDHTL